MSVSFPASPTVGQIYQNWIWSGSTWDAVDPGLVLQVKRQIFTGSGTYTPSPGLLYADIECLGGGGGGGGSSATGQATGLFIAGGGGAGSYSRRLASKAQIGASQAVTIGAGGVGTYGAATAGGATALGALATANGGNPGGVGDVSHSPLGGGGGAAGTGDLAVAGAPGQGGHFAGSNNAIVDWVGAGASTQYGAGGLCVAATGTAFATAGNPGLGYGAGGGGSGSGTNGGTVNGGAGAPGLCIVTEYCWVAQAAVAATQQPGARVLIQSQVVAPATPVANVNFFYNFTNTYDVYEFEVYDVQRATSAALLGLQVSTDGTTFDAGASSYSFAMGYAQPTGASTGSVSGAGSNGYPSMSLEIGGIVAAAALWEYQIRFALPWTTDRYKYFRWQFNGTSPSVIYNGFGGGAYTAVLLPLKGIRFLMSSGNITRGVFNLYGIVKAGAGGS